jgi:hypothetical protein
MCYARPPANNDTTGDSVQLVHKVPLNSNEVLYGTCTAVYHYNLNLNFPPLALPAGAITLTWHLDRYQ